MTKSGNKGWFSLLDRDLFSILKNRGASRISDLKKESGSCHQTVESSLDKLREMGVIKRVTDVTRKRNESYYECSIWDLLD